MSILLISGSTRAASTNTATLRTLAQLADDAHLYQGLAGLPAFNPDDDGDAVPETVAALRNAINNATAVVICTPEYAGQHHCRRFAPEVRGPIDAAFPPRLAALARQSTPRPAAHG